MGLLPGDVLVFRAVLCFESKRHRCLACAGRDSLVKSCCAYLLYDIHLFLNKKNPLVKAMAWLGILFVCFYLCTRPLALPPAREVTSFISGRATEKIPLSV